MNTQRIKHKQGDTFEVLCMYADCMDIPINLTAAAIVVTSQVRTATGDLVSDMTVAVSDQNVDPGEYRLRVLDTSDWPVAELRWDIQYAYDNVIVSTETLVIAVQEDVTHG